MGKRAKLRASGAGRKGFGKDGMWLLMEVIIIVFVLLLLSAWLVKENPQKPSCSLCRDVSCPSGFAYSGDCTMDGSGCGQCRSAKTCDGNTAEEWVTAGTCSVSKHVAQCVKRADCGAKACTGGECA